MLGHFRTLLEEIAEALRRRLAELSMLSETEHELLLGRWSEVGTDGPAGADDAPDGVRHTPLGTVRGASGEARR